MSGRGKTLFTMCALANRMETETTDGPPWLCADPASAFAPAAGNPQRARSPQPASSQRSSRRGKASAPRWVAEVLPFVDRLAISLTVFAAVGLLVGAQNASPSHSRELAPIIVTVPTR